MKRILLILSLFTLNYGLSQSTLTPDSLNVFYILDSYWTPPHIREYPTDDTPNYIQINNGIVMITGRVRGKTLYFHGKIQNVTYTIAKDGNKTINFYAIGKELSNGKMASFQLIEKNNEEFIVNYYSKYTKNNFFNSHLATSKEIEKIKTYWKTH